MTARRNSYGPPVVIQMAAGESTSHTNTTDAADVASLVIPKRLLRVGDNLKLTAVVEADSANSTDTHTAIVTLGTAGGTLVTVATTGAVDVASGDVAKLEVDLIVTAVGADGTGAMIGVGRGQWSTSGAAQTITPVSNFSNIDTLDDITISVNIDHSVASASNQTSCKILRLEIFPSPE